MVESTGLENRNSRKAIEGSNPSPSAAPPQNQYNLAQTMFWIYVLWSFKLHKRYVDSAEKNPEDRLMAHNWGKTPFTSKGIPWILIHSEFYPTLR